MQILYNQIWLYRSIAIVILIFVLYRWNSKANFVAPYTKRRTTSIIYSIASQTTAILAIILPLWLQISLPSTSVSKPLYAGQILFDVSLSMTAKDLSPSRFSVAKKFVYNLLSALPDYQRSTIFFSGIPVLRTAYSDDNTALLHNISSLSMGDFPPTENFVGTAIGDALLLGLWNTKHIQWDVQPFFILITDGDSNTGYDPLQVLPTLQKLNIPVYTIWLWSGSTVIGTDTFGTNIYTAINIPLLKKIAQTTRGKFFYVQKPNDFTTIAKDIERTLHNSEQTIHTDIIISINQYILCIVILLLCYIIWYRVYVVIRLRSF